MPGGVAGADGAVPFTGTDWGTPAELPCVRLANMPAATTVASSFPICRSTVANVNEPLLRKRWSLLQERVRQAIDG